MFLSKLGKKHLLFTPTPNNFIAQAATTVCTEVAPVPQKAVPTNLLAQISSYGPVPPAVTADTNAAAELNHQRECPIDGDQTLLNFSPLTTVTTLELQWSFKDLPIFSVPFWSLPTT